METTTKFLQKWRVRLGHLFAIAALVCAKPTDIRYLAAGTAIALFGESIRIASAGYIQKDKTLSRSGPYAFTRNPLYVGSFLMYLGFCIAASNVYVIGAYVPFFFVIYYATIYREETYLREAFGAEYEKFCAEVPRFFPRLWPAHGSGSGGGFSFAQAAKNREYEGAIAIAIITVALWAMYFAKWHLIK
jgi:protein-S-isoprenylcysteine O-methyltransferase Ste14